MTIISESRAVGMTWSKEQCERRYRLRWGYCRRYEALFGQVSQQLLESIVDQDKGQNSALVVHTDPQKKSN